MQRRMFWFFIMILIIACMAAFSCSSSENGTEADSTGKTEKKKKAKKPSPAQENLLDINTATADQLKALQGVNDEDVKKIIAGRPYARKNQLKQKKIISASTYDGIKTAIIAKKSGK